MLATGLVLALPTAQLIRHDEDDLFTQTTLRYEIATTIDIIPYQLFDAGLALGAGSRRIGREELAQVAALLDTEREKEPPLSELFGVARDCDLILISAESLQAFPIGLEVNGQPIAPRFAELADAGRVAPATCAYSTLLRESASIRLAAASGFAVVPTISKLLASLQTGAGSPRPAPVPSVPPRRGNRSSRSTPD